MKFRFESSCLNVEIAARMFGAAILLAVLLANFVSPQLFVVAAKTCQLACCKGMSPHAEDGCAGGACHPKQSPQAKNVEVEEFCGANRLAARVAAESNRARRDFVIKKLKIAALYDDAADDDSSDEPKFAAPVMRQPCRPDCGAANFNSGSQNRSPEKSAFFASAAFARPPTSSDAAFYRRQFVFILRLLPRDTQSRAPPVFRF